MYTSLGWGGLLLLVACTTENQTKPIDQPGVETLGQTPGGAVYHAGHYVADDDQARLVTFAPGTGITPQRSKQYVQHLGDATGLCVIAVGYENSELVAKCCTPRLQPIPRACPAPTDRSSRCLTHHKDTGGSGVKHPLLDLDFMVTSQPGCRIKSRLESSMGSGGPDGKDVDQELSMNSTEVIAVQDGREFREDRSFLRHSRTRGDRLPARVKSCCSFAGRSCLHLEDPMPLWKSRSSEHQCRENSPNHDDGGDARAGNGSARGSHDLVQ